MLQLPFAQTPNQTLNVRFPVRDLADRLLWKRYEKFAEAYATLKSLDTKDAAAGSGPNCTAEQKRAFKKWEAAITLADRAARKVISTPANTIQGMLMKIHLAGFLSDGCAAGTFSMPYRGIAADGEPQFWQPNRIGENRSDEFKLVLCLRDDLHRMQVSR